MKIDVRDDAKSGVANHGGGHVFVNRESFSMLFASARAFQSGARRGFHYYNVD